MIQKVVNEIKTQLKANAQTLTQDQKERMLKILNSSNPNFKTYALKLSEIEKIVRDIFKENNATYNDSIEIFKILLKSNIDDEKFAGFFLINRFKKQFDENTINLFHDALFESCDTWALCDSSVIRIIGPFLSKNDNLAKNTIKKWSHSENLWIQRASMVILLKIIALKKDFDASYVFNLVEKMLSYPEDYIQKGIGWLLKTCLKYKPNIIFNYLEENKKNLTRLILRYASEKLPKEKRVQILKK